MSSPALRAAVRLLEEAAEAGRVRRVKGRDLGARKTTNPGHYEHRNPKRTAELGRRIRELDDGTRTRAQIARILDVSGPTVCRYLSEDAPDRRQPQPRRRASEAARITFSHKEEKHEQSRDRAGG